MHAWLILCHALCYTHVYVDKLQHGEDANCDILPIFFLFIIHIYHCILWTIIKCLFTKFIFRYSVFFIKIGPILRYWPVIGATILLCSTYILYNAYGTIQKTLLGAQGCLIFTDKNQLIGTIWASPL